MVSVSCSPIKTRSKNFSDICVRKQKKKQVKEKKIRKKITYKEPDTYTAIKMSYGIYVTPASNRRKKKLLELRRSAQLVLHKHISIFFFNVRISFKFFFYSSSLFIFLFFFVVLCSFCLPLLNGIYSLFTMMIARSMLNTGICLS